MHTDRWQRSDGSSQQRACRRGEAAGASWAGPQRPQRVPGASSPTASHATYALPLPMLRTPLNSRPAARHLFARQRGYKPMHWAAERGHAEVIAALVTFGADPNDATKVRLRRRLLCVVTCPLVPHHHCVCVPARSTAARRSAWRAVPGEPAPFGSCCRTLLCSPTYGIRCVASATAQYTTPPRNPLT